MDGTGLGWTGKHLHRLMTLQRDIMTWQSQHI